jgi:hypothetical protein
MTVATTKSIRGFVAFAVAISRFVVAVNTTVKQPPVADVDCTTHEPNFTVTCIAGVPNGVTSNGVPFAGIIPARDTNGLLPDPTTVAFDAIPNR